jgi:heparinase II/III-like protein
MLSSRKLQRLRKMDLSEIRFRLSQRVRIARERMALARGDGFRPGWSTFWNTKRVEDSRLRHALESHDDGAAAELFCPYLTERFFDHFYPLIDAPQELFGTYRQLFPGRAEQIIGEAERLRKHRMQIFAYGEVDFGVSLPWRQDVIHGIDSELVHWSRIPYLDFRRVGDSKITWEPNRHQHFVTLALAYRLTGNEGYAEECFTQWEDWQCQNPYLFGINWVSSLELAFRALSWIWMIHLLARSRAMTGQRLAELTRELALHANFISANLSTYYSPNTHLLGEGFALFAIGLLFPELRHSEAHRETGRKILLEEITKQVRRDGSHAEQSTYYHGYAADFFLCAAILADRNGCSFPSAYRGALEHMIDFMMHSAWPNGSHPMVGDADGGRLLPFGVRDPNDHRSTLSTAAVYFERGDLRDRAGQLSEETLWLLGPHAATRFQGLIPKPPVETSKVFPQSGFVVMRNGWQSDANMLAFEAGPQGMDSCGHGHADALSVVCSAQGTNWLVDPGTFVYTASKQWRDYFRSTQAHNTLVIDGQGQAQPGGPFKWLNLCPARLESWATLPNLDYASGMHEGYRRLAEPVVHRRRVAFVKPDRWFLLDDLSGAGTHSLEFFFHFPPDVQLRVDEHSCWATKSDNRFLIIADPRLSLDADRGEEDPVQGWYSRDYGHREPAPVLAGNTRCTVPAQFPWILWPGAPDDACLRQVPGHGSAWALETIAQADCFIFSDALGMQPDHNAATDADFAFLRQGRERKLERMTLVQGSWLNLQGAPEFRSRGKCEEFNLVCEGESLAIRMQPVRPFTLALREAKSVRLNGKQVEFTHTDYGIAVSEGN